MSLVTAEGVRVQVRDVIYIEYERGISGREKTIFKMGGGQRTQQSSGNTLVRQHAIDPTTFSLSLTPSCSPLFPP